MTHEGLGVVVELITRAMNRAATHGSRHPRHSEERGI